MDRSSDSSYLAWTETVKKQLLDAGIFQVYTSRRRASDGSEADFAVVDAPDWCHVIAPVEHEGSEHLVMVRQYRHGVEGVTLEFPGGIVDPGEDAREAARRELAEETGYECDGLTLIGSTNPNPAFMTNRVHVFLATGVRAAGAQELDQNERVDIELIPAERILSLNEPEFSRHAIMLAGLVFYKEFLESKKGADRIRTGE